MKVRLSPLSYNEWELLRVLWESGKSLSRPEIIERLPNTKEWKPTTVSLLINTMLEKGFLKVDGVTRCGKHAHGRTFAPTMEQFDFIANHSLELVVNLPENTRIFGLIASLMKREEVTLETLEALEQMTASYKEQLLKSQNIK